MTAMTSDQYPELVEFLGRKFEEAQRHATALFEQSREELRTVVEGLDARFDGVDRRLDAVDARFDGVDRRFDAVDARFDAMDARFDAVDARFDAMDRRVGSLEGTVATLDVWVRRAVTDHEARIQVLE